MAKRRGLRGPYRLLTPSKRAAIVARFRARTRLDRLRLDTCDTPRLPRPRAPCLAQRVHAHFEVYDLGCPVGRTRQALPLCDRHPVRSLGLGSRRLGLRHFRLSRGTTSSMRAWSILPVVGTCGW